MDLHEYIIPAMFFIALVLILTKKDRNLPNYNIQFYDKDNYLGIKEYERGYTKAQESIKSGADVDELLFQAETSLTNDQFDKGWKHACEHHIKQQKNILVSNRTGK